MQFCKTKQKQNAEDGNLKSFGKNNETEKLHIYLCTQIDEKVSLFFG